MTPQQERLMTSDGSPINPHVALIRVQTDTITELTKQWMNPSVVVAMVLMFVGGNVIQEALAQSTGRVLTPVCFSFGWISYAFSSLKSSFSNGGLLPPSDYPAKVFDVRSGYCHNNQNWLIGRILRDHESWISKIAPPGKGEIRIAIFEAERRQLPSFHYNMQHLLGVAVIVIQLMVAAIPTIHTMGHEWGILAITSFGTLLAIAMGSLPQWRAEKISKDQYSNKTFALTAGRGSRDVMVIKGRGRCLDLRELAMLGSPRTTEARMEMERPYLLRQNSWGGNEKMIFGRPIGSLITRSMCIFEVLGWCLILISLASIQTYTWYLIAVGAIGWVYNAMLAGLRRRPGKRNLPLRILDVVSTHNIMDGLMDLEETHEGCGKALLSEFFPGRLRPDEEEWWNAKKGERASTRYDQKRIEEGAHRLPPRSLAPEYDLHEAPGGQLSSKPIGINANIAANQVVSSTTSKVRGAGPTSDSQSSLMLQNTRQYQSGSLRARGKPLKAKAEVDGIRDARSSDPVVKAQSHVAPHTNEAAESSYDSVNSITLLGRPSWD
ncbi:hypothetical protein O1611_g592 [Lasiodiplodia mahajangana]|uniref:Uncharacterized protein n=1 Tax=Lasiodiplodia mahajangana TaxID=1108764 RepID=A0ACC2K0P8_9PEZI|nr:hypothetical protein O1611_g592 [Lasiodiplodia mahajangana]